MAAVAFGTAVVDADGQGIESFYKAAGVLLTGDWVYLNGSNQLAKLDNASQLTSTAYGLVMSGVAGVGQTPTIKRKGLVSGTATLTVGERYFAPTNANAGKAQTSLDSLTTQWLTHLGHAPSATTFLINIDLATVAHA